MIEPPDSNVLTYEDSGEEDEGGTIDNLNRQQLSAHVEVRIHDGEENNQIEAAACTTQNIAERLGKIQISWIDGDLIPSPREFPKQSNRFSNVHLSPVEMFEKFIDDQIVEFLVDQSNKYALFLNETYPKITCDEMKCCLAILILSGYAELPGRDFYWDVNDDMRNHMNGYDGTGTIRENRIPMSSPLTKKKYFQKQSNRGDYCFIIDEDDGVIVVKWVDNNVVAAASTCHGTNPTTSVKRFSRVEKKMIYVSRPSLITEYNRFMGGTDFLEENTA
ncbi:hypothetical protein JTB14_010497 [Gonioctena quinquepunctata]|nr:hypothetical protein JTB14_010497 [Gonioctena quinquepunctata]